MRLGLIIIFLTLLSCKQDGEGQSSIQNESYLQYTRAILEPTKDLVGDIYQFKYSINGNRTDRTTFYEYLDKGDFIFGRNDMNLLRENKNGELMIREHDLKGYTKKYLELNAFEPEVFDITMPDDRSLFVDLKAQVNGPLMAYAYDPETGLPITSAPFNMPYFSGAYEMTVFIKNKTAKTYRFVVMIGDKIYVRDVKKSNL